MLRAAAAEFGGLDGREVLEAIRAAVPTGLEVRVFLGIHHNGAGPASAQVVRFIQRCLAHEVAFKATAGLHHAVRTGGEHGFLNLLAAVVMPALFLLGTRWGMVGVERDEATLSCWT